MRALLTRRRCSTRRRCRALWRDCRRDDTSPQSDMHSPQQLPQLIAVRIFEIFRGYFAPNSLMLSLCTQLVERRTLMFY
eukprot:6179415-Pleurochrysis_carterae.AAC.1